MCVAYDLRIRVNTQMIVQMACIQKYGICAMIHEAPVIYIMNTLHVVFYCFLFIIFPIACLSQILTLSPWLSESTKPKVNSYRCDVCTSAHYTTHSNRNHCIERWCPSIFQWLSQCLHSACNNFNIPTSSCDYLIFISFSSSLPLSLCCKCERNWIDKQL